MFNMSQSLFYWNPFCNINGRIIALHGNYVAILILLESFLQYYIMINENSADKSRNPYFIGILSAIPMVLKELVMEHSRNPYFIGILSAIIFKSFSDINTKCRNPYFIGILSAILEDENKVFCLGESQSLFYWNPFCNKLKAKVYSPPTARSQSLFYWNPFCNLTSSSSYYLLI